MQTPLYSPYVEKIIITPPANRMTSGSTHFFPLIKPGGLVAGFFLLSSSLKIKMLESQDKMIMVEDIPLCGDFVIDRGS
jgi:hypothetical protein